jgi:hypothetical protein
MAPDSAATLTIIVGIHKSITNALSRFRHLSSLTPG